MKVCPQCSINKSDNEFYRRPRGGLQSYCKSCLKICYRGYRREFQRKQRQNPKYKARERIQQLERYRRDRKEMLMAYSRGTMQCACCGESEEDFLTLDHINGGGSKQKRELRGGSTRLMQILKKEKYPTGYQVLCMNCNLSKGKHGSCIHNTLRG